MEKLKNNKKLLIGAGIALLLIVAGLIIAFGNNGNGNEIKDPSNGTTEMTKEEATNIIKDIFHGDNYSFNCEKIEGGNYKVTVTNTLNGRNYYYFVDAATRTYVLKTD